jgi:leucyl-tRNA synthetase
MSAPKDPNTATTDSTRPARFDPASFEEGIRVWWEKEHIYKTRTAATPADKQYILGMFPYPSGDGLHTGHARIFTGTDILARYYRMQGKAVLFPMGWDAFGLPAENAAIKKQTSPQKLVPQNIANFKRQFQLLGISYDWAKEINTTDPNYYAITQALFILFYKHGLLYKKDTMVYYCPFCKTGLALEEVQADGTHERCGNTVEKRTLPQWIFRIQEYADSLLKGLDGLDWPKGILEMQRNWIGKKEGIEISYPLVDAAGKDTGETVTCFTTRPETNFGATFIVLAPEHPFVEALTTGKQPIPVEASGKDITDYVKAALRKTERERMAEEKTKTGVFTGYYAVNALNGEKLPVWVSDFVLVNVGTGAVVGVPAHDKRDYQFAATFGLPVKRVVEGPDGDRSEIENESQVQEESGKMFDSEFLDTMDIHTATVKMMEHLEEKGMGKKVTSYHLRDWIFSRQRYWGEPIPMVYCQVCADKGVSFWDSPLAAKSDLRLSKGPEKKTFQGLVTDVKDKMAGWFPLETSQLPLTLPEVASYEPTESGASPLSLIPEWVQTLCPCCGAPAKRETDTMPNWAGSCWYFMAYPIADQIQAGTVDLENPLSGAIQASLPVDWYLGGTEHAVLHLLYARFWMHALNDLGSVTTREPFKRLRSVGMLHGPDGQKMSKSKGNVIVPDEMAKEYGVDALRVYEMFMAPFNQQVDWSVQTLQGAHRFVRRIWQIYSRSDKMTNTASEEDKELASELQKVIAKITRDIPDVKFNTPISSMMEFLNLWEKGAIKLEQGHAKAFLKLLAPFAPYVAEHIWHTIFEEKGSIHLESWPTVRKELLQASLIMLPVQVNGKVRHTIQADPSITESEALEQALQSEQIKRWVAGEYSHIYVPGRILNIVTKD